MNKDMDMKQNLIIPPSQENGNQSDGLFEHDGANYHIVGVDNLDSLENVRIRLR